MTLKNFCKLTPTREKLKQKRRTGVLSPLTIDQKNEKLLLDNTKRTAAKSKEDENVIYQALVNNEFLKNVLTATYTQKLIDQMQLVEVQDGSILLEQGQINSYLFISKSGTFQLTESAKQSEIFQGSRLFGEVAILHSAKASQTVKAVSKCEVWILDCVEYKNQVVNSQIEKREEIVDFLKEVPSLRNASNDKLYNLCDMLQEKYFPGTRVIVKEGEIVNQFLIVTSGNATILTRDRNKRLDKLTRGCFFGDYIFLKESVSLYTIIADPPGVNCLVLYRSEFLKHFRDLDDFLRKTLNVNDHEEELKYDKVQLKHLKELKTLGLGGFGRVVLVQNSKHKDDIFALKLMKKHEVSGQTQIDQVYNEKDLQMACDSDFIVKLYKTFRDTKYIYFLLEACMGGDLWNLLRRQRRKYFDTDTAKFYAGCILEAFDYLHSQDIVYRDLKPENVMVSSNGYLKLTDFGFAKKIATNEHSYSFVGTAEYVSPELIQNLPHDRGVDYWALGVFIFELLVGKSPFRNDEHNDLKTYKAILKGIDFVSFPYIVSPRARNLIKKLCRPLSVDRIGCQKNGVRDIRTHPWFSKLDWVKLRRQELEPPIRICLNGATDTRYFETFKEEKEDVIEDFSTWDEDF